MKSKILIISTSYPKNKEDFSGVFVHNLVKRYTQDYEVIVLSPYCYGVKKNEIIDDVKIIRFKYWFGKKMLADGEIMDNLKKNKLFYFQLFPLLISLFVNIIKIVKKENIRVIHAFWIIPNGLIAAIYKLINPKIKIVCTLLGADVWSFSKGIKSNLLSYSLKRIDYITTQSSPLLKEINKFKKLNKATHLPIGIDTNLFIPSSKNIDKIELLYVGALSQRKGVRYLIEAMKEIIEFDSNINLNIIGNGPLQKELEKLISDLNISKNVKLLGAKPNKELPSFFKTADIFILPSFSEGFPLVIMEALSSGTIPIVSNLSVFLEHPDKEILFNIIEPGNTKSISKKIIELLNNRENIKSKKNELRKYAEKNLNINKIAKQYIDIINSLN